MTNAKHVHVLIGFDRDQNMNVCNLLPPPPQLRAAEDTHFLTCNLNYT